ncbi:hypothetical protein F4561_005953 [Lipingzhangella halophila]|uniref:Uncharacterized protein n=1 Tax=Lipingzhangella halophila TaxID=1783352 RepID=A0A7W7RN60_9ACTN|nr:hypothetical protein [Lipingzhangella halophila]MBB4935059.1 hypothetical protein [Lipingzhangella halophila]
MAHSAPDPTYIQTNAGSGISPRFLVILAVLLLLATPIAAVVWYQGGFAAAATESGSPQDPGTEIRNDLFTVKPTEAAVRMGDANLGGAQVVVRAELTSHESEAVAARTFADDLIEAHLMPAEAEGEMGSIEQVRDPGSHPIQWIQPELTETVLLVWELPEDVSAGDVERVRLRVLEAEESSGFIDESERWWSLSEESVGEVDLPVEGE